MYIFNLYFWQKQGVILVSNHIISLNRCLLLNIHLRSLCPLQSDIQGKLEKAARSLEKLYCRKYLGLGLILSLCDVETLLFFLTVGCTLGWRKPLLSAALFPSVFFPLNLEITCSLFYSIPVSIPLLQNIHPENAAYRRRLWISFNGICFLSMEKGTF